MNTYKNVDTGVTVSIPNWMTLESDKWELIEAPKKTSKKDK